MASIILGLASAACALVAAFFWFKASAINVVPTWAQGKPPNLMNEPLDQLLSAQGWITATAMAVHEGGKLNKVAALWSAAAAVAGAFSVLVGLVASWLSS
ncbi:hypothetical protein [Xanthobacter sediminis]